MYAQTIAYGLLSARVSRQSGALAADDVALMAPVTSPFLRELMETFLNLGGRKRKANGQALDFDELGIADVVEMLRAANMEAVLRDFDNRNPQEVPVVHFYELFLKEYDSQKRMQRGVFYTPKPVVSYIVRSVHELLQTEFGLPDGLADTATWGEMAQRSPHTPCAESPGTGPVPTTLGVITIPEGVSPDQPFVTILDPATGTATFLVEVIEVIHATMTAKWRAAGHNEKQIVELWNDYVPEHLLPRLYGFELLMAPYAIAHMKIGLKLADTGYQFRSDERARVYLTNSLEPAMPEMQQKQIAEMSVALAHEAQAVNAIKRHQRFTVVIGNPPYAGHSTNTGEWITQLVDDYYVVDGKSLGEKNPKWLQDDYVKFIRLGQFCIAQTGTGILSYISNHGYIDNPTFRGMRQCLLGSFDAISILDLHGNTTKKERPPDGSEDVNVFDIKQGVAIFSAWILDQSHHNAAVTHGHLFGTREHKYQILSTTTFSSQHLQPASPATSFYLFVPQNVDMREEYDSFMPITTAMPVNVLGFQTHRDHFAVDLDKEVLLKRISEFRDTKMTDAEVRKAFDVVDNRDWHVRESRRQLREDRNWKSSLILCSYRPFDFRPCYFSTVAMDYPRRELLDHVAGKDNLCLGVGRQGIAVQDPIWSLISVSKYPVDANIFRRGGINVFPLYLYPEGSGLAFDKERHSNFSSEFLKCLSSFCCGRYVL
jgi:predicted helicase